MHGPFASAAASFLAQTAERMAAAYNLTSTLPAARL
jgi:hypothetical protein